MTDSVRPHRQQPTKLLLSLGFSRQEYRSGLPFPSPMHESEKWKWNRSVVPDSWWPHGLQPTRLFRPWDFQGKSTGVGCHCLLRSAHYRLCKNGGRLPCIDLNGIPRGGASRSRCKVKFLKQGAGYPWGLCAGHLHWTPLVDLEAVLSPVPWGLCNVFSFSFFFSFFPFGELHNLDKTKNLEIQLQPDHAHSGSLQKCTAGTCAQLCLAANPIAGADTWQPIIRGSGLLAVEAAPQDWGGVLPSGFLRLNPGTT